VRRWLDGGFEYIVVGIVVVVVVVEVVVSWE